MVYRGVKRRHAVVSYQCTIGNIKTQHGAELKPQVWLVNDLQGTSRDKFMFINKILFHPIKNPPGCSRVVTVVLLFDRSLCEIFFLKKKKILS